MAQQTFLNLKPERQAEILQAALQELASKEYEAASLSAIVQALGVAKGSFYRYFDSKKALYLYLLDHVIAHRLAYARQHAGTPKTDFAEMLTENFAIKIKYDLEYPLYSAFAYNAAHERNSDELGNIQKLITEKLMVYIVPLVKQYQETGVLRSDIPDTLMAFQVYKTQTALMDYLELQYGFSFRELALQKLPGFSLPEEEMIKTARHFSHVLVQGIKNPEQ